MPGIGIITNPYAKLNKRNPERPALLGYIAGSHGKLEVTRSERDLNKVVEKFYQEEVDIIAINGGDGSISKCLTSIIENSRGRKLPKIALLRGGTINVLANNLGIKGTPERLLFNLIQKFGQQISYKTVRIPAIKVQENYGFLFASGTAPAFLREYYKVKSNGLMAALWAFWVLLSRWLNFKYFVKVLVSKPTKITGETETGRHLVIPEHMSGGVFCSTLRKLPLGLPLFKGTPSVHKRRQLAKENNSIPEHMELFSFRTEPKNATWRVPAVFLLSWAWRKYGENATVKRFSIQTRAGNEYNKHKKKPSEQIEGALIDKMAQSMPESLGDTIDPIFDYTLDGELMEHRGNTLEIELGPSIEFVIR